MVELLDFLQNAAAAFRKQLLIGPKAGTNLRISIWKLKMRHHLYRDSTQDKFLFLLKAFEGTGNWFLDQSEDIQTWELQWTSEQQTHFDY